MTRVDPRMPRAPMLALLAFLTGALASSGVACESRHVDQNFGTEAGADFDAPPAEASLFQLHAGPQWGGVNDQEHATIRGRWSLAQDPPERQRSK